MGAPSTVQLAVWVAAGAGLAGVLGCGAPNARPAQTPPAGADVVAVEGTCAVDDEEAEQWLPEDRPPPIRPVEYVKMSEWTPPPSVQALEAIIPPRGDVPPSYIQFPELTTHSSVDGKHARRH